MRFSVRRDRERVLVRVRFLQDTIFVCRLEPSSNQVNRPVYKDSVSRLKHKLSFSDQKKIYHKCDMLKELGYPPPPTYLPAPPSSSQLP